MALLATFYLIFATLSGVSSDYCGENKVPYGLEVFHSGQLVLLCSRPSCFERRFADCDDRAVRSSCDSNDTWVGGLEKSRWSHDPMYVQCCHFDGLEEHSTPLYLTTINPGEYFEGEEQTDEDDNEVVSFDVITNLKMIRNRNNTIAYEMTVRRLHCIDLPSRRVSLRLKTWP